MANEPSFSSLFLSWGPLGAEVVPKLSPRASWASNFIVFYRFLTDWESLFEDLLLLGSFFYSSLHLRLVTGDQCSGHGGGEAAGKWIILFWTYFMHSDAPFMSKGNITFKKKTKAEEM